MNTPREWEEEFEDRFVGNSDPNWMPELHRLLEKDREEIKSFIRTIEDKVREDAVREHDAKWHPINENFTMENCHSAVKEAIEEERERMRKLVEGMKERTRNFPMKSNGGNWDEWNDGYDKALSDIIKALNEKEA